MIHASFVAETSASVPDKAQLNQKDITPMSVYRGKPQRPVHDSRHPLVGQDVFRTGMKMEATTVSPI